MDFTFALRVVLAMIGMSNSKSLAKRLHSPNDVATDIGILSTNPQRNLGTKACRNGYLICKNGFFYNGNAPLYTTCADYCDGQCCVGLGACDGFSGTICRDRKTCMGDDSCGGAKIKFVGNACRGKGACYKAGASYGNIEFIEKSCVGNNACNNAAYNGGVGTIRNGCNADTACENVAKNNPNGILRIENACNGMGSCVGLLAYEDVGAYGGDGGDNEIEECCNGDESCVWLLGLPVECDTGCGSYTNRKACQSNFCTWSGSGNNAQCIDP